MHIPPSNTRPQHIPTHHQVDNSLWTRRGWAELDALRSKLENLKELRDLVRSLGRGGGWGPLRRAPTQHLDMGGRPGLLRTVLEAQETRGLTRSDDISRLLPSEVCVYCVFGVYWVSGVFGVMGTVCLGEYVCV